MSNLHVSVVIPAYNGGEDLRKCLKAINESSYRSHECILVDDASTDGMTDEIALMKISGCCLRYMYSAVVMERSMNALPAIRLNSTRGSAGAPSV